MSKLPWQESQRRNRPQEPFGAGSEHPEVWRQNRMRLAGMTGEIRCTPSETMVKCCGFTFETQLLDRAKGPYEATMRMLRRDHEAHHAAHNG